MVKPSSKHGDIVCSDPSTHTLWTTSCCRWLPLGPWLALALLWVGSIGAAYSMADARMGAIPLGIYMCPDF